MAFFIVVRHIRLLRITSGNRVIKTQKVESINKWFSFEWHTFCRGQWLFRLRGKLRSRYLKWQRPCTFVVIPLDAQAFVRQTGHHAGTSEHAAPNRVGCDVDIQTSHNDVNDNKVVDVFHIITDGSFAKTLRAGSTNDQVPAHATLEIAAKSVIDGELALAPADFDLEDVRSMAKLPATCVLTRLVRT